MDKNEVENRENINLLEDYERAWRKILFELQNKRILLEECRQELNDSLLKQQDLERQLLNEKQKTSNDTYQSDILHNAAEALEEERQRITKDLVNIKVERDLAVVERDSLRDEIRSHCLENFNLKRKNSELENKLRCHSNFERNINEQVFKIKAAVSQVNDSMENLRSKQNQLEKLNIATNKCEQLLLVAKNAEKLKKQAEKQRDELETKLVIKSGELAKALELLENYPIKSKPFENTTVLDYWKNTATDLQSQLKIERDGTLQLTNALKLTHDTNNYLEMKIQEKLNDNSKTDIGIQTENEMEIIDQSNI